MILAPYESSRDVLLAKMSKTCSQTYVSIVPDGQEVRPEGFVNYNDKFYIKAYAIEHLVAHIGREHLNQYKQKTFDPKNLKIRAITVDHLFEAAARVKMDDKSIVYEAVSLLDRYYSSPLASIDYTFQVDCLTTGYTCLFISSKNSEVEPLNLKDIKNHFLQRTQSSSIIISKETDIRRASNYENEVPTMFDFVMILMKIWKLGCQNKI